MVLVGTSISPRRNKASQRPQVQYGVAPKAQTSLLGPTLSHAQASPPMARVEIRGVASLSLSRVRAVRVPDRPVRPRYGPTLGAESSVQRIASMSHVVNLRPDLHQIASRRRCDLANPRNDPIFGSHDVGNQSCSRRHRRGETLGSYHRACDIAQVTRNTRCCSIGCHSGHQTRGVVVDQVGCRALRRPRVDRERGGKHDDALGCANVCCAGR